MLQWFSRQLLLNNALGRGYVHERTAVRHPGRYRCPLCVHAQPEKLKQTMFNWDSQSVPVLSAKPGNFGGVCGSRERGRSRAAPRARGRLSRRSQPRARRPPARTPLPRPRGQLIRFVTRFLMKTGNRGNAFESSRNHLYTWKKKSY